MRLATLFWRPINLLRSRAVRASSPHTSVKGLVRIYGKNRESLGQTVERNLAERLFLKGEFIGPEKYGPEHFEPQLQMGIRKQALLRAVTQENPITVKAMTAYTSLLTLPLSVDDWEQLIKSKYLNLLGKLMNEAKAPQDIILKAREAYKTKLLEDRFQIDLESLLFVLDLVKQGLGKKPRKYIYDTKLKRLALGLPGLENESNELHAKIAEEAWGETYIKENITGGYMKLSYQEGCFEILISDYSGHFDRRKGSDQLEKNRKAIIEYLQTLLTGKIFGASAASTDKEAKFTFDLEVFI